MITNDKIWKALDRVAREHGLTGGGLARAAELDQTIFNPSKRRAKDSGRPRWPSSETIAKVLNVTGLSMSAFGAMVDADLDGASQPAAGQSQSGDGGAKPADGVATRRGA
jgi:phage repressor protein C with HTH and peptisase S24 domain